MENFPRLMTTCVKQMRESLNTRFNEQGSTISSEQWIVLTHLEEQDGLSQQDLAKKCDRTEVSIFNLLKKLESAGYILRMRDPVDARCNRVFLTAEGRKHQQELVPVAEENIQQICQGVEPEEIERLKQILQVFLNNLDNQ